MHWEYNIVKCAFENVSKMCGVYQARPFEGPVILSGPNYDYHTMNPNLKLSSVQPPSTRQS